MISRYLIRGVAIGINMTHRSHDSRRPIKMIRQKRQMIDYSKFIVEIKKKNFGG